MDGFGRLFGAGYEKGNVDNGLVWTPWMSLIHEFLRMQVSAGVGILVPQPGIEPGSSAVKVQSPNHSDVREFWEWTFFFFFPYFYFFVRLGSQGGGHIFRNSV